MNVPNFPTIYNEYEYTDEDYLRETQPCWETFDNKKPIRTSSNEVLTSSKTEFEESEYIIEQLENALPVDDLEKPTSYQSSPIDESNDIDEDVDNGEPESQYESEVEDEDYYEELDHPEEYIVEDACVDGSEYKYELLPENLPNIGINWADFDQRDRMKLLDLMREKDSGHYGDYIYDDDGELRSAEDWFYDELGGNEFLDGFHIGTRNKPLS